MIKLNYKYRISFGFLSCFGGSFFFSSCFDGPFFVHSSQIALMSGRNPMAKSSLLCYIMYIIFWRYQVENISVMNYFYLCVRLPAVSHFPHPLHSGLLWNIIEYFYTEIFSCIGVCPLICPLVALASWIFFAQAFQYDSTVESLLPYPLANQVEYLYQNLLSRKEIRVKTSGAKLCWMVMHCHIFCVFYLRVTSKNLKKI